VVVASPCPNSSEELIELGNNSVSFVSIQFGAGDNKGELGRILYRRLSNSTA